MELFKVVANCNDCKHCQYADVCKRFKSICDAIFDSPLSINEKYSITAFIIFVMEEYRTKEHIKKHGISSDIPVYNYHKRLESLKHFNSWNSLVKYVPKEDLDFFKETFNELNELISVALRDIITDNHKECMEITNKLNYSEPDYDKMSKEELIAILKNK